MTWYKFLIGLCGSFLKGLFRVKFVNRPKSVPAGPLVLCSNHISLIDAVMLAYAIRRPIVFLAKKDLFDSKFVGFLLKKCGVIPLNRDGEDISAVRQALGILKSGGFISIFPQGTRRRQNVRETEMKNGAGMLISLSGAEVICAGINAKGYKVRPFRKTVIAFGEARAIEFPAGISSKDRNAFVTSSIGEEIALLSEKAGEML